MKHPLTNTVAQRMILKIFKQGVLAFSSHAYEEMANDDLDENDVRNTLRGGWCRFCEDRAGSWRYRFETYQQGAVIAFRTELSAVVVTAFRLKKKR